MGDPGYVDEAILAVDRWLAAVEKDPRDIALAKKIIEDKPADLGDRCTNGAGQDIPAEACDATVQSYSDPQIEAGMPLTDDVARCNLKPLRREDYPVTFTDAQWADLVKTFPQGVCDYSKPGEGRAPTTPWQTYQERDGSVIYGGRGLGDPPASKESALLVSSKPCVSRRRFSIRVRAPKGTRLKAVSVYVNGKRRAVRRGRALRAPVSLRGLPRGTVRVTIVATTTKGRRLTVKRRYRTCAAARR